MESRVSLNFFFLAEPEPCFSDGTGIPAGQCSCLWRWAPFRSACRCRSFFGFVFLKTVCLVLSWLWSGVSWQPSPFASLFLFVSVTDTPTFASGETFLHTCAFVLGDLGSLVGQGMPWTCSLVPSELSWNSLYSVVNSGQQLHPTFSTV